MGTMSGGKTQRCFSLNYFDSVMFIKTIKDQCQRVSRDSFIVDMISFILPSLPRDIL
jgi:hypothetical protein